MHGVIYNTMIFILSIKKESADYNHDKFNHYFFDENLHLFNLSHLGIMMLVKLNPVHKKSFLVNPIDFPGIIKLYDFTPYSNPLLR